MPQRQNGPSQRLAEPELARRPVRTLQFKAVVGATVLVAVATGLCGWMTSWLARAALTESLHRDVRMLADTSARAVADEAYAGEVAGVAHVVTNMTLDERIAFIAVTDQVGRPFTRRIADADAWRRYADHIPEADRTGPLNLNKMITLTRRDAPPVTIFTRPIWSIDRQTGGNHLAGYMILAMSDLSMEQLIRNQALAGLTTVCIILIFSLPAIIMLVRSFTRPIRQMVARTVMLAEGRSPDPVRVPGNDEISQLASAFNQMAERLSAMRTNLIATNAELEQQVRRRTQQLHQANQQLVSQMQDKDEFIRAITHDLNAPVRNIAGMTKLLLKKYESDLADDALSKLQRIAANAKTETELLADLLELSRIRTDTGKVSQVDTNELVAGIVDSLSYDIEAKRIDVQVAELPPLFADRNRLRQVFQNLIDNAIKYMPGPDAAELRRIEVGVQQDDESTTPVLFVRDTGRGINEKDHQRVFQVFQRARYSGETEASGRGVGLASVKTIIETYGGNIWLASEPGRGSTFYFTFAECVFSGSETDQPEPTSASC
jgi:signal transduction histidine kinase